MRVVQALVKRCAHNPQNVLAPRLASVIMSGFRS